MNDIHKCLICDKVFTTREGFLQHQKVKNHYEGQTSDDVWGKPCRRCGEVPTLGDTALCGPCTYDNTGSTGVY